MTRTNFLSCLIKGDLISRFDFDFSKLMYKAESGQPTQQGRKHSLPAAGYF